MELLPLARPRACLPWRPGRARTTGTARSRGPCGRVAGAYTIAEIPDLYNTQHIDLWWCWMYRDGAWANLPVFRYVLRR